MKVVCKVCGVEFTGNRSTRCICGTGCANHLNKERARARVLNIKKQKNDEENKINNNL